MKRGDATQARLDAKIFNLFAINRATQVLTSILDLPSLATMAVDVEVEMAGAKHGALYLRAGETDMFRLASAKSLSDEQFPPELSADSGLIGAAMATGRPFLSLIPWAGRDGLIVPGQRGGVCMAVFVLLDRSNRAPWVAEDLEVLETLAAQVAVCVQNARLYQQVTQQYEALKAAQEQLVQAEKLATMGTLLAGVAHELNNPLAVVIGQVQLLKLTVEDPATLARAEKIATAGGRCARIVKNFLALARQRPPERQLASLNAIVRDAVELIAYQLRVDDVEVVVDVSEDLPALWVDGNQLHQVILNLVSNAHQAMRNTPPPRRVKIVTRAVTGERVSLEVADTGPGIAPEIRARIFDPFFTTKPPGQGTGLGLALCQSLIEAHGGTIRVTSEPGHGASFIVELPVGTPVTSSPTGSADVVAAPHGKKILVIDDEAEVATVLADMLELDGHQVDTAENGVAALAKLEKWSYDVVFSDLRMPELDGPGLWRIVEQRNPLLLRRFVFVTGDTLGPEVSEFLGRTTAPSVIKPFALDELRRTIAQVLGGAQEDHRDD